MEPLVIVSAAVVLVLGYRTVMEIIKDVEGDGSLDVVQELCKKSRLPLARLREKIAHARSHKIVYYGNFFLSPKERPRRTMPLKRHA